MSKIRWYVLVPVILKVDVSMPLEVQVDVLVHFTTDLNCPNLLIGKLPINARSSPTPTQFTVFGQTNEFHQSGNENLFQNK